MTLIEVTVVLVILAILAGILVPAMTGWLDKGREKSVISACGTCVFVAQTLANESADDSGGGAVAPAGSVVTELAGLSGKGSVSNLVVDGETAVLKMLTYTESASGLSATYERAANPQYRLGGGVVIASQKQSFEALLNTYQDALTGKLLNAKGEPVPAFMKQPGQKCVVDSIAADNGNENEPYAKAMLNALTPEEREFLKDKSWQIQNTNYGVRLFFTEQVYTKEDAGKTNIVVYKYDASTDKYQRATKGSITKEGKIGGNPQWGTQWYTWQEIQDQFYAQS